MADKRISELPSQTSTAAEDLLLVIDDPNGTPTSKKITVKNFFASIAANSSFTQKFELTGNTVVRSANAVYTGNVNFTSTGIVKANNICFTLKSDPATNNAATESKQIGQIWFSNTYIYVAVNRTTIKRAALSTF